MDRGKAKDRRRARRRRALVACALALLVLPGIAGCGESGEEKAAARQRAAVAAEHAREMSAGRRVFAQHCQACHALAGRPFTEPIIEFEAPDLDEVRPKRAYVEWRVTYGGPAMASFVNEVSPEAFRAVVTYVTETAGRNVESEDPPPAQLAAGKEVFAQHCAACHGIAGSAALGEPEYPGVDFNLVKPSMHQVKEIALRGVLDEVPEARIMPSFRGRLTAAQLDDVAAYVNAVAAEGPEAPRTPFE